MSATSGANELRVVTRDDGPVARWVEVEVPALRVSEFFARAYRSIGSTARVRGFRPGKAPASVLRKLYGPAVSEDVERELVGGTLASALEQAGIEPVSQPRVESDTPVEGAPFQYRARVEVKPAFDLPAYKGFDIKVPAKTVTDKDVDEQLQLLRERKSSLVPMLEDRPLAKGDFAVVDNETFIEGSATRDAKIGRASCRERV